MDWKRLIADLRERGLTYAKVADEVGCKPGTLKDLSLGRTTDPAWTLGDALIKLRGSRRRCKELAA